MSQENVEVVRSQFGATNEGDFEGVTRYWSDDIELVVPGDAYLGSGTFEGKDAVGRWFADWFRSFERGYRFNLEEARDLGDTVLVVAKHHGRGRTSGAEVQLRMAYLYRVCGGKVVRIELYSGRAEALEAVGLSEQDAHADS